MERADQKGCVGHLLDVVQVKLVKDKDLVLAHKPDQPLADGPQVLLILPSIKAEIDAEEDVRIGKDRRLPTQERLQRGPWRGRASATAHRSSSWLSTRIRRYLLWGSSHGRSVRS